jgi:uncharacterized protein YdeI (YjbR/CyaY-like superfamily)
MKQKINDYYNNLVKWKSEAALIRKIFFECNLKEAYKWMHPCYTFDSKNIVVFHDFKDYCAISFFKGALLKDPKNILIQPTENSQAGRQIKFTNISEIEKLELTIKAYILEAIQVEKAGLKIDYKKTSEFDIPDELHKIFESNPEFKTAFYVLTPGRQKGYLLHFSSAKQSQTRIDRIEKYMDRIFDGKGIRDCACGHSKRMPICDGSHKYINKK